MRKFFSEPLRKGFHNKNKALKMKTTLFMIISVIRLAYTFVALCLVYLQICDGFSWKYFFQGDPRYFSNIF